MNSEPIITSELLQKFLDTSGIGWWRLDFGTKEMTCSTLAAELFGIDHTRISLEELYTLPQEEHRARLYTRTAALKVTDTLDETFVTTNGGRCLRTIAIETGTDPQTGNRIAFGTLRRIADQSPESEELMAMGKSFQATQRNYSHLAQLIEHLPIGYLRVNILRDKNGVAIDYLLSYINQQAERTLGIQTKNYAGKTAREINIDPQPHIAAFVQISPRTFWEQTWVAQNTKRICRSLIYNTPNDDDEFVILLEDITDATHSRQQLDDFEKLFKIVSDFAHVGCLSYNLSTGDGYTKGPWSQNYGEAKDTPISEIFGTWRYIHPEDRQRLQHQLSRLKCGEIMAFAEEVRIVQEHEPTRWIMSHTICRNFHPTEGVIDLACVNYDITNLKRTEEELREAKVRAEESNKLKSAFLANMSHEIRTPLNSIVGFSELLEDEPNPSIRKEYGDIIRNNNVMLLQIISDVLDLARIESGSMEVVRSILNARDFCQEMADSARSQCRPGVELRIEEGLPELFISAYYKGLCQIIGNFTRNAVKFTKKGSITIGFKQETDYVRFYVRDTGIGIPPEQRDRIFDRFVKLDTFTQGTGLGLSICKSIVEQLGGNIGVDSTVGEGSCFWLDISGK